jgi:hypothetical protein
MSDKAELISVVYYAINEIGKNKIRSDVISDIKIADEYMDRIFNKSSEQISNRRDYKTLFAIYEILLHFMLTACTVPSQRKVKVLHLTIDLVIPNLHTLSKSPRDAILLQYIRTYKDMTTINELLSLLKLKAEDVNRWLITTLDLNANDTTHIIKLNDRSHIISDIDIFLRERKDKSLRLIHF